MKTTFRLDSFFCLQGLFTVDISSSQCGVHEKYEPDSDAHGPHHDEVVEGGEVPGLDGDLTTLSVIADLVGNDPLTGVPVHHIPHQD